jgi:hypothetical protein
MLAKRETESVLLCCTPERAYDVFLRSSSNSVPARLVLRVPEIESVVMHGHAAKIFCSGFFVETYQMVGIEFVVSRPLWDQILESDLCRMAISLDVILVLLMALDINVAGEPVSVFDSRLRSPMRPYTEFGLVRQNSFS